MICSEEHNKIVDSMALCGCMIVKCTKCSFWEVLKECEVCLALRIDDDDDDDDDDEDYKEVILR